MINFVPMKIESGPDVGISPRVDYTLVDPEAGEAGYDLFDANMLAFVKQHFIDLNDQRFTFSIESGPMKQWSRVFAEFKGK